MTDTSEGGVLTEAPAAATPYYNQDAAAVVAAMRLRRGLRADGRRGGRPAVPVRAEPDHEREAAVGVGGRAAAAPRPDEHHARRGRRRQPRDRRGVDRRCSSALLVVLNVVLGARQELDGAGQRRRAVEDAGAAEPGACGTARCVQVPAVDVVPGDIVQRRGRRHRARRRPDRPVGHAGDAGGGADRRERADRQGGRDARPAARSALGDRANMLFQNTSVTRGTGHDGRDGDGHGHPDGPDRDDADVGRRGPGRRCRRSSTRSPRCSASSRGRRSRSS